MAKNDYRQSQAVVCNIDFIAHTFRIKRDKIAEIMGLSYSVFYKRIANPEEFRLEEIERLANWATKKGMTVSLAQMCRPFVPAKVDAAEVSA